MKPGGVRRRGLGVLLGLACVAALRAEVRGVSHPEEEFPGDATVVWTPVFQAGWDAMNRQLGGTPRKCSNRLAAKLDRFEWQAAEVLPEGRWRAWSGPATAEFFGRVDREAAEFLGGEAGPFQPVEGRPGGVAFYALLDAELAFWRPFHRSRKVAMAFHGAGGETRRVHFWGVRGEESADFNDSVRVLGWRPSLGCHAVQLRCLGGTDETLVLFRPPEPQDFATACRWVRTWRRAWRPRPEQANRAGDPALHAHDTLRVPYLVLQAEADFKDRLQGLREYAGRDEFVLSAARQRVDFELHERGARARVAAEGGADPFGAPPQGFPRDFSYDRPFFVFLWRDQAEWPYFGAWIGDAAAMHAWSPE